MNIRRVWSVIVMGLLFVASAGGARAQGEGPGEGEAALVALGTGFTYQGRLASGGSGVTETCAIAFGLWNALGGGAQLGITQTVTTAVTDGYFTTVLNGGGLFGPAAYDGQARWLALAVRCPASGGTFTLLSPRQPLLAAPYAQYASGNWGLAGNTATTAANFLGTTDNLTLTLAVSGTTAFRLAPTGGVPNVLGGDASNAVGAGAEAATIGGGANNTVSGDYAHIGGGAQNTASHISANVSGGFANTASGQDSTVGGGFSNTASGPASTVAGGTTNSALAPGATVGGGGWDGLTVGPNLALGDASVIGGGISNTALADYGAIGGGTSNTASGIRSTVGGGQANTASGIRAVVGGGGSNTASGTHTVVSGGFGNTASGGESTVGGGLSNIASGFQASIGGGESNDATAAHTTIGGGEDNLASLDYATVSGGGSNTASADSATVSGGYGNTAGNWYATVGGGLFNVATQQRATVSGGELNDAIGFASSVGGGYSNTASSDYAAVGGGRDNVASGLSATIPGGYLNLASGDGSFAAGTRAHAIHDGSFVWSSANATPITSTDTNQFLVRATNGFSLSTNAAGTVGCSLIVGTWNCTSDRNAKANFAPVDGVAILNILAGLPIETWNFNTQDAAVRHMGPMAQDWYAAFGLGEGDTTISAVDADGVALAAIQGLYSVVQEKETRIAALEARLAALESVVETSRRDVSGETLQGETPHQAQVDRAGVSTGAALPWLLLAGLGLVNAGYVAGRKASPRRRLET